MGLITWLIRMERRDAPLCSAFAGLVVLVGVGKEFIMKMIFALK